MVYAGTEVLSVGVVTGRYECLRCRILGLGEDVTGMINDSLYMSVMVIATGRAVETVNVTTTMGLRHIPALVHWTVEYLGRYKRLKYDVGKPIYYI